MQQLLVLIVSLCLEGKLLRLLWLGSCVLENANTSTIVVDHECLRMAVCHVSDISLMLQHGHACHARYL